MNKELLRYALVTIASFIFVITVVQAWTVPTGGPPDPNVAAPINVGSDSQIKAGDLAILGNVTFGKIKSCSKLSTDLSGVVSCSNSYSWVSSSWGACSLSCGSGTQNRTVSCQRDDGLVVDDSSCLGAKPALSQSCNTQSCCNSISPTIIFSNRTANGYGTGFGVWTMIEKSCNADNTYNFIVRTSCLPDDWGSCNGSAAHCGCGAGTYCDGYPAGRYIMSNSLTNSSWSIGTTGYAGCVNAGVYQAYATQNSSGIVTVTNGYGNSSSFNMNN
ncbi:MAG: hypothetical protein K9M10_02900 [Candidatus Pacebacteria bacterium]|nr:hypothetical protein [Candidatus Paceibacterota bacterium]MCF7857401.1 hypothetical protein [Candidatus Paceibacterota bacterium]